MELRRMTEGERKKVEENLNLIHHILKKYPWTREHYDDYFQIGAYGLCLAAQRFDESKGYEFSTYAGSWITGCILRHNRDFEQGPIRPTRISGSSATIKPKYLYANGYRNEKGEDVSAFDFIKIGENKEDETILKLDLERIRTHLSERENSLIDLSLAGKVQMEIAKELGMSQAQVSRTKNLLREKFKKRLIGG